MNYCIFTCICATDLCVKFWHLINQIQYKNTRPVKSSSFSFSSDPRFSSIKNVTFTNSFYLVYKCKKDTLLHGIWYWFNLSGHRRGQCNMLPRIPADRGLNGPAVLGVQTLWSGTSPWVTFNHSPGGWSRAGHSIKTVRLHLAVLFSEGRASRQFMLQFSPLVTKIFGYRKICTNLYFCFFVCEEL